MIDFRFKGKTLIDGDYVYGDLIIYNAAWFGDIRVEPKQSCFILRRQKSYYSIKSIKNFSMIAESDYIEVDPASVEQVLD
jgi:hypothetical protein